MKRQIYGLDIYTRIILTIIAVCLVVLAFRPNIEPESLIAYERLFSNEKEYPRVNLNIGQIGGWDLQGGAIPVMIIKQAE